jgi:nicotinate-nucleotide adenylyltransferase
MNDVRKIGIFAGSFDPIHRGHIACARQAMNAFGLDRVLFVVEPRPRHKQGVKAFEHRSAMVQRAIADIAGFQHILIDDPYCTTTETLPMLRERFHGSELYVLMGDDVAEHIAKWPQVTELLSSVQLAIILRKFKRNEMEQRLQKLATITGHKPRVHIIDAIGAPISSSKIRLQLKREGTSDMVQPVVLDYIRTQNLYGSSGLAS